MNRILPLLVVITLISCRPVPVQFPQPRLHALLTSNEADRRQALGLFPKSYYRQQPRMKNGKIIVPQRKRQRMIHSRLHPKEN
jgi:hypothetical protein